MGRFGDFLLPWLEPRAFEPEAFGVGHPVTGGEYENPLSLVRGADFSRAEYSPRHLVTQLFQVADDCGESQRDVALNVFEEAESWLAKLNSICNPGPEVPWIVLSLSFSCGREGLAVVDNCPVGAVALVFFNGDVVYISNSAWIILPDVLPAIVSLNLSGSISVRNNEEILVPLIDNSAFNILGLDGFVFSDGSNHSESSLSEEGERNSQAPADRGNPPVVSASFATVSVPTEVTVANCSCSFGIKSKNPSREMFSGCSRAELAAEIVEFFLDDSKSSGSSFSVPVEVEPRGGDFLLEEVRLLVVAADCDSSAMLGWGFLPPSVGEVPSDDPPELGASVVLHNFREHLTDSVPSLKAFGVLPSIPCVEGVFVCAYDSWDALCLDFSDMGTKFRHDGGNPAPPSEMSESHVSNDDLLDGDESSVGTDDGSCPETRVTSREDVHQSAKFSEREGFKIRPNRSRVQESRFHF